MTDTKFTPGPWGVNTGGEVVCEINDFQWVMAKSRGRDDLANAHLIAAAPELWSELYETHSALMFKDPEYLGSERYKRNAMVLAKARGES